MRNTFLSILSALLLFIVTIYIGGKNVETSDQIKISIKGRVIKDDKFQLFYSTNNRAFSEQQSLHLNVTGSKNEQVINFTIPYYSNLNHLRIDIGNNRNQEPIELNTISFEVSGISKIKKIDQLFSPNEFIDQQDNIYRTKVLSSATYAYDPFLVSKKNLSALLKPNAFMLGLNNLKILVLALIFAISIFFVVFHSSKPQKLTYQSVFTILFLFVLFTPNIVQSLSSNNTTPSSEKRRLAPMPKLRFNSEFPSEFEAYFNDNFGLRQLIISYTSLFKVDYLGVSTNALKTQLGKNGFLFYNGFSSASTSNNYSLEERNLIVKKQKKLTEYYAEKDITYIVGYWPNKHTIYPEFLPYALKNTAKKDHEETAKISKDLKNSGINFFDITENIIKQKSPDSLLYKKLDTHWNYLGCFKSYQEFCNQTFSILNITPYTNKDITIDYIQKNSGDLISLLGTTNLSRFTDSIPQLKFQDKSIGYNMASTKGFPRGTVITLNPKSNRKETVLVYCDSYCTYFRHYLSLHFPKVIYIWSYPLASHPCNFDKIEAKVNADIIINCCVERFLPDLFKWHNLYKIQEQ